MGSTMVEEEGRRAQRLFGRMGGKIGFANSGKVVGVGRESGKIVDAMGERSQPGGRREEIGEVGGEGVRTGWGRRMEKDGRGDPWGMGGTTILRRRRPVAARRRLWGWRRHEGIA